MRCVSGSMSIEHMLGGHGKNGKHKFVCREGGVLATNFFFAVHVIPSPSCIDSGISMFKLWLFIHFGMMMIKWITHNTFLQSIITHTHSRRYLHNLIYNVVRRRAEGDHILHGKHILGGRSVRKHSFVDETDVYVRKIFSIAHNGSLRLRLRLSCLHKQNDG